jgi:DNA-directed RNA polymerase subunit RPC12/RpoP
MKITQQGTNQYPFPYHTYKEKCKTCNSTIEYTGKETIEHQQWTEQLKKDPWTKFTSQTITINCPVCNHKITTSIIPQNEPDIKD